MGIYSSSFITVAAANSTEAAKSNADFVCTGRGDELTIQTAVDECIATGKNLFLHNGRYRVDAFHNFADGGPKSAIRIPSARRELIILGENFRNTKDSGVTIYVTEEALLSANGEDVDVIRTAWCDRGIGSGSALRIENIAIALSSNRHRVRCIDLRRCDRPEIKNMYLTAIEDMNAWLGNPPSVPTEGCIGLTLTDGSNQGFSNYTDVLAIGFYEGIQVGGEHVILTNCGTIMCFYGFTFGNYEMHCGFNHPITLINCCDERNVNLPLFNRCGDDDGNGGRLHGLQEVKMISFNIERIAAQTPGGVLGDVMREVIPGSFRGTVEFTAQPSWCHLNEVNFKLWEEDGSGSGFVTRNVCHKTVCTTEERLSYYPSPGQQIYDTDLNKILICTDPAKRKWVDALGVEV